MPDGTGTWLLRLIIQEREVLLKSSVGDPDGGVGVAPAGIAATRYGWYWPALKTFHILLGEEPCDIYQVETAPWDEVHDGSTQ